MVFTSHNQLGSTGRPTGFWLEEGAAPYCVFRDAGVELTLASPRGGQPPLDPKSDLPENQTPAMARFKKEEMQLTRVVPFLVEDELLRLGARTRHLPPRRLRPC